MIYFDHNATTPIDERVVEVMLPYLTTFYGNPSSLYRIGRVVRSAIDTARAQVAALVSVTPEKVIFTSSGTEANNLALNTVNSNSIIAVSSIEHPSIIEPASLKKYAQCIKIAVTENGVVSSSTIKTLFQSSNPPALISIMLANNENGVIQDLERIVEIVKDKEVVFHSDAVQAIGKIPVNFSQLGIDLMSMSSHKIYGPKGCGALVVNKDTDIEPLLHGGGQENSRRAGTENVAAIVGFGKAAELAALELEQRAKHCLDLRNILEQQLKSIPNLVIFSEHTERIPNTVQFGIQDVDGEMLLMQFDQKGIAVSSGSACASGGGQASSVLIAMGVEYHLAKSAIRISLGKATTEAEIKKFIKVLKLALENRK